MDSSKEDDVPVFLDRSSRLTRGKRYRTTCLGFLLLGMDFVVNWHEMMEDVSNCMNWGVLICYRMTKLLDEEAEEDELFWNQDALKEVCLKKFTICFSSLGTI